MPRSSDPFSAPDTDKERLFRFSETQTKRKAALYCCLPSLLGDGYSGIGKGCVRKNIFYWADQSSQCRTKTSRAGTTSPTNQLRKESKDPAICTLWVPIHLIFNWQYGLPLYSLSGYSVSGSDNEQIVLDTTRSGPTTYDNCVQHYMYCRVQHRLQYIRALL